MYPSSFEYFAPTKMKEALELLSKYGEEAKIMAGGQSLIPLLKLRIAAYSYVIDISRVEGLNKIQETGDFLEIVEKWNHRFLSDTKRRVQTFYSKRCRTPKSGSFVYT
ncbi:MAG: FAD binding domain-containing protein [Thermoplasmatales archaeon]|nr:FAD binding domain-containing protein [Thermoplasmatales archaeon]